jgi:hypothetical protein
MVALHYGNYTKNAITLKMAEFLITKQYGKYSDHWCLKRIKFQPNNAEVLIFLKDRPFYLVDM